MIDSTYCKFWINRLLRLPRSIATRLAVTPLFLLLPLISPELVANSSVFMQEYDVSANPLNIVVESPGRVWFTLPQDNAIGSLVVSSDQDHQFQKYELPNTDSEPYDLVYDPSGAVWFTELKGNRIGRLDIQTGSITEYTIPTANSAPTGIALDPDGNVWFAERDGNKLGKFDPDTETFVEYPYPLEDVRPEDVAVQPKGCAGWTSPDSEGCVWSTGPNVHYVFLFTLETEVFQRERTSDPFLGLVEEPWNLLIDHNNTLWVTTRRGNRIGRYAPGTVVLWFWSTIPTSSSGPVGIASNVVNDEQHIWFTESTGGKAGQLLSAKGKIIALKEHALPSANSRPMGIAVDSAGAVWIADNANGKIVRWTPPYFHFIQLPLIAKASN